MSGGNAIGPEMSHGSLTSVAVTGPIPFCGRYPNPDQLRRNHPVERREIKLGWRLQIETMPFGTYEASPAGGWSGIPGLWDPLLQELIARSKRYRTPPPVRARLSVSAREYQCRYCGAVFLGELLRKTPWGLTGKERQQRYCSDRCEVRAGWLRWRELRDLPENAARTEYRRQARANLKCARCDRPIASVSRSSRKYCSNACRVADHRARRRHCLFETRGAFREL